MYRRGGAATCHLPTASEEPNVHIVTKILIVFCSVLSLLLAALTMAYAANANVLRASIKSEQELARAAQTTLAHDQLTYSEQLAAAEKNAKGLNDSLKDRTAEVAQ